MSDEALGLAVAQQSPLTQGNRLLDILRRRTAPGMKPSATPASRCVLVSLVHYVMSESGGSSPAHICQKVIDEKLQSDALDEELIKISEELAMEAMHHAGCHKSTQMYAVCLYGKNDVVLQQHRFNAGPPTNALIDGDTEPSNLVGVLSHLMRHNEVNMRMNQESWRQMQDLLAGENQRLRDEAAILRAEVRASHEHRLQTVELVEALKDGKAKRDQEAASAAAMEARGERLLGVVEKQILPELVAKYSQSGPAKSVFGSLKPEQVAEIASVLTPEQKKAFWALLPEEMQAELAAVAAAANGTAAS